MGRVCSGRVCRAWVCPNVRAGGVWRAVEHVYWQRHVLAPGYLTVFEVTLDFHSRGEHGCVAQHLAHLPVLLPAAPDLQKRRITEMLSQLPTEVDVMKLITLVIMGSSPVANDKSVKGVAEGGKSVRRSSVLGSGGVAVNASAANNAQATQRSSTMELPAGGGGGAAADDGDMGVADSKAWKGLLARATSVKGGGSFASPKRV